MTVLLIKKFKIVTMIPSHRALRIHGVSSRNSKLDFFNDLDGVGYGNLAYVKNFRSFGNTLTTIQVLKRSKRPYTCRKILLKNFFMSENFMYLSIIWKKVNIGRSGSGKSLKNYRDTTFGTPCSCSNLVRSSIWHEANFLYSCENKYCIAQF